VPALCLAVDAGGTFLDIVVLDAESRELHVLKIARGTGNHGSEIREALSQLGEMFGIGDEFDQIVVGTTVVTNGLLEGRLARVALVTTEGFRDVLALGRMQRASSYNLRARRPVPLVPEDRTTEVKERIDWDGSVLSVLDATSLYQVMDQLVRTGTESVGVCLLHSYANDAHERAVGTAIEERLGIPVTLSCDLSPLSGEYERMSTTVLNAAAVPTFGEFAASLDVSDGSLGASVLVMSSAGTCLPLAEARAKPVATVLSGPAGGVAGGLRLARRYGEDSAITLDVGGTSTDVALLSEGAATFSDGRTVGGYAVALPSLDIHTIGAGGGSLARVDHMGLLSVGPESAGSNPGPVCYGRGGAVPTVTDCYLAVGLLGEGSMLGGDFPLSRSAAVDAVTEQIAASLGTSWAHAARGVIDVATQNMVRAVRRVSIEKGYDPRRAALIAFGGAGPLHAVQVARALGMRRVLVPSTPGVFAAVGMLLGEVSYGRQWTWLRDLSSVSVEEFLEEFEQVEAGLAKEAVKEGLLVDAARRERDVQLRYRGQGNSLTVPVTPSLTWLDTLAKAFHDRHQAEYHYHDLAGTIEVVSLRSSLVWTSPISEELVGARPKVATVHGHPSVSERTVWESSGESTSYPVYRRESLRSGDEVAGPALIEQYDSVTLLERGDTAHVEEGILNIELHYELHDD
jgi:N-methylhydantoinase A